MYAQELIDNVFTYHAPKPGQNEKYEALRAKAKEFAELMNRLCPDGPEKDCAFSDIQTAVMWANAAIARRG